MPTIYFAAAAVGVLVLTAVAAFIKSADARRQLQQQMNLQVESSAQEKPTHDKPAAMVTVNP